MSSKRPTTPQPTKIADPSEARRAAFGRFDGAGIAVPDDFDAPLPDDTLTFDESGVDLTQIDMMLAMTPRERLRFLYETASSLGWLMPDAETDQVV